MYTTLKILIGNQLTLKTLLLSYLLKTENNLSVHLKNHQLNLVSTNKKLKFYFIFKNETKYSESRENELRERIPVPHDNFLKSI